MRIQRRFLLLSLAGVASVAAVAAANPNLFYNLITEDKQGESLSTPDAYSAAQDGAITLVDIRRPDEWSATGSGEGAMRLDMRRDDFVMALLERTGGNLDAPVALICARGVRSARMAKQLTAAGFTQIVDIPEGMMGSKAGPGWIERGLPLDRSP